MTLNLKKLNLEFKEEGHIHLLNGSPVPGCTSISGLFPDDGWKFAWPVKLMEERILEELATVRSNKHISFGMVYYDDAVRITKAHKNAWRQKRDKSADTGTRGHQLIENYIKSNAFFAGIPLDGESPEVVNIINEFVKWTKTTFPEWLGSEIQVASETNGFAGILDAIAEIDGKLVLVDFKTSASIKEDYAIQLAGLMICLEEMGCKPDLRAILHLPKEGEYEYRILDGDLEEEKKDFLAGLAFYQRKNLFKARCK